MPLDVNTQLGQDALKWAQKGADAFLTANDHLDLTYTDPGRPAEMDALIHARDGNILKAVVEIKTRYMTLSRLMDKYDGKTLINRDKMDAGTRLAKSLRCDFILFVVLPPTKVILVRTIADHIGWAAGVEEGEDEFRKTTNDADTVKRKVVYIDMTDAKKYNL